jgi:signal transduction histidine kinase
VGGATTIERAPAGQALIPKRGRRWFSPSPAAAAVIGTLVSLATLAAALIPANISYERSSQGHAESLLARGYVVNAELAARRYWHEREVMNEYLLRPSPQLLAEASVESAGVAHALAGIDASSSHELALLMDARAANRAFKADFVHDTRAAGTAVGPARILEMDRRAHAVLRPLNALARVNAEEVNVAQATTARASARLHFFVGLALLVFLFTILFWAFRGARLVRRIAAQNRELKLLDSLKDEFVASVSHELRTPLTSIRGYIELMLDEETGPLNETQRKFLSVVERSTERQMMLVADLLLVAQLGAADLQLDLEPLEVGPLLEEAVEAARPTAEAKGIELDFTTDQRSANVIADAPRLAQVMDNLISNAIKFTPAGRVLVELRSDADDAVIDVVDTGIGIPPDEQERLFERFFRATAANTNAIQGTGLGLAISKAIADAHAGTIELESSGSEGTTFRLTLPLAP